MPDINDLARELFRSPRDVVIGALGDLPSVEVPATVKEASEDGVALVDFGGETTSGEDVEQWVEITTDAHLEEGDEVFVSVKSGKPVGVTNPGWGDKVVANVADVSAQVVEAATVASDAAQAASEANEIALAATELAEDAAELKAHFWADSGGAHVGTAERKAHEAGAGYNMTLGATGSTVGIILDHDDQTLASITPSGLDFYADGKLAAGYTKDGMSVFAQDANGDAQQVSAFTASGVTFFDGEGNDEENVVAAFGKDGAVMGATGGTQVSITSSQVSMLDEGEVVAYVGSGELGVGKANVTDELALGNFSWIPRSNGNLALKWMGA